MGLQQARHDKLSSATVRYQSFVVGLDRLIIGFTFSLKLRFFIASSPDTASNTQTAASPGRWLQ